MMPNPMMGGAMPAQAGLPPMPSEPQPSVTSGAKRSMAQRKSSSKIKGIALLVCSTLLLAAVGTGVYWVLNQNKPTVAKNNPPTPPVNENTQDITPPTPPRNPSKGRDPIIESPLAPDPEESTDDPAMTDEPGKNASDTPGEEMPAETSENPSGEKPTEEMPAEEMPAETPGDPEKTKPEEMPEESETPEDPEKMVKPTDKPEGDPSEAKPEGEPLSDDELAELSKHLQDTKSALSKFDFAKVEETLAAAEKLARTSETKGMVDRLTALATNAAECRGAIINAINALKSGDEVELKSKTRFSVVEVGPNLFLIRLNGTNRPYKYNDLPAGLAMGMADRALSTSDPQSLAKKGAYLILIYWADPKTNTALKTAKEMLGEAKLGGVDTDAILGVLDDKYDLTKKKTE